jgi:hypothetical protein
MNPNETGACFDVVCKRCNSRFNVIRNWGGGLRREDSAYASNPARCQCGSYQLEIY